MPIIVPTVTETTASAFHARVLQLSQFASRLHLDYADGEFAPNKLAELERSAWPQHVTIDMHVMYQKPLRFIESVLDLKPDQVTLHAESNGNLLHMMAELKASGIHVGIALLPESSVSNYGRLIEHADSVLIFGGKLGFQGGLIDESQLIKVPEIKAINPKAQLAWDGGINIDNALHLVKAGIDILNVGGAIAHADDPKAAFLSLQQTVRDA